MAYPNIVTVFPYQNNQPTTPDLGSAANVNALHVEVDAIENTLGPTPFNNTPWTTLNQALFALYTGKSPLNHTHDHTASGYPSEGDNQHTLYMPIDGSVAYTGAVSSPPATAQNHLVTIAQVQGQGYLN